MKWHVVYQEFMRLIVVSLNRALYVFNIIHVSNVILRSLFIVLFVFFRSSGITIPLARQLTCLCFDLGLFG